MTAWSYQVERRIGTSVLIREYFDALSPAVTHFDGQVQTGSRFPHSRVELLECNLQGTPAKLLRRWTYEDGLTLDRIQGR